MKKDARDRARKTRDESKERWSKQGIKVCPGWKIRRADELNWNIESPRGTWHYGRLHDALSALPHKLLDDGAISSIYEIQKKMDEIMRTIDRLDLKSLRELQNGVSTPI